METVVNPAVAELSNIQKFWLELVDKFIRLSGKIVLIVIIFIIGLFIIKLLRKAIRKSLEKTNLEMVNIHYIDEAVKFTLFIVLILLIAGFFGVQATSIVAILGSAGLTVGLALQGSLSNLAAGMLIMICKPFVEGDYIIVGNGDCEGTVSQMGLIYTHIVTVDNRVVQVPNSHLSNTLVTNNSMLPVRMLMLNFYVDYESDITKVKEVVRNTLLANQLVINPDDMKISVVELADSGIKFEVRVFVKSADFLELKLQALEQIKIALDKNNIVIPYNHLDVHIK